MASSNLTVDSAVDDDSGGRSGRGLLPPAGSELSRSAPSPVSNLSASSPKDDLDVRRHSLSAVDVTVYSGSNSFSIAAPDGGSGSTGSGSSEPDAVVSQAKKEEEAKETGGLVVIPDDDRTNDGRCTLGGFNFRKFWAYTGYARGGMKTPTTIKFIALD